MSRKMAREPGTDVAAALPPQPKKIDSVIALLRRPEGASLDEMIEVTGWLPHTTRAALTGLKKKGHVIARASVDGVTRYTIAAAAAQ